MSALLLPVSAFWNNMRTDSQMGPASRTLSIVANLDRYDPSWARERAHPVMEDTGVPRHPFDRMMPGTETKTGIAQSSALEEIAVVDGTAILIADGTPRDPAEPAMDPIDLVHYRTIGNYVVGQVLGCGTFGESVPTIDQPVVR